MLAVMKNFIVHILLLVALCVVCSRCKHELPVDLGKVECGEAGEIDEMMEWVYFKTGTYWIYKEQNTGALDTMTVFYDYNGVSEVGNRQFLYKIISSRDGFTYSYWFNDGWSGDCPYLPNCYCRAVDCERFRSGFDSDNDHVFIFPLKLGNKVGQYVSMTSGASEITEYHEIDTINELVFTDIYVFHQDLSPQHQNAPSIYSLSKNVGIIKKEVPNVSEIWELIEYEIIQ
jgi:hypothetical protein